MKKKEERTTVVIGDTVETVETRRNFKLIRKGLSLGFCGTIFLNSVVPKINGVSLFSGLTDEVDTSEDYHMGVVGEFYKVPEMRPQVIDMMSDEFRVQLEEEIERQRIIKEEMERQRAFDECIENYCPYFNLNS